MKSKQTNTRTRNKRQTRRQPRFRDTRWMVGSAVCLLVAVVGTVYIVRSHAATNTASVGIVESGGDYIPPDTSALTPEEMAADSADIDNPTAPSPDTGAPFFAAIANSSSVNLRGALCQTNGYNLCAMTDNVNVGTVLRERGSDYARTLQFVYDGHWFTEDGYTVNSGLLKFADRDNLCIRTPDTSNIPIITNCNLFTIGVVWGLGFDGKGSIFLVNRHYSQKYGHLYVLSAPNHPSWRLRVHKIWAPGWYQRMKFYAQS